jgi:hypothetical protein
VRVTIYEVGDSLLTGVGAKSWRAVVDFLLDLVQFLGVLNSNRSGPLHTILLLHTRSELYPVDRRGA